MIELTSNQYGLVWERLSEVEFNTYFCQSVLAHHVSGRVFADSGRDPNRFYVLHSYGMSLLFGDEDEGFATEILSSLPMREAGEWLQVSPLGWARWLTPLVDDGRVQAFSRQCFAFDPDVYARLDFDRSGFDIVETSVQLFTDIQGAIVPSLFWTDAELFASIGKGFTAMENGTPVSTAYAAYVHGDVLELGIETVEGYKGRGYALAVCTALIDYCLANGLEPQWSCRFENTGSMGLAKKLGFQTTLRVPIYRIPPRT